MINKENYKALVLEVVVLNNDVICSSLFIPNAPDVYEEDPFAEIFIED